MSRKERVANAALSVTRWVGSPESILLHTVLFSASFFAAFGGFIEFDRMLLVLTTIVSLEAIYLAIFIQMTINYQAEVIEEVQEDVEEMQEDVEEIQEDVDEIQKDVDEIQEDVDELHEDVEEIADDEEEEAAEEKRKEDQRVALENIESTLQKLIEDIAHMKTTRQK